MIRGRERFLTQLYAITDLISSQIAFILAWYIQFNLLLPETIGHLPFETYWFWSLVYGGISLLIGYTISLYSPKRKMKFAIELAKILQVHVFSMFMLLSLLFLYKDIHMSRSFLLIFFAMNLVMIALYRLTLKQTLREVRRRGYNKQFVLIVGAGKLGEAYYNNLQKHPEFGLRVVGLLDDFKEEFELDKKISILGKLSDLESVLESRIVDEVVIALPLAVYSKYRSIVATCEKAGVRATIIPDFYDILPATPHFESFGELPIINVRDVPLDEIRNRINKRVFDVLFSLGVIVVTAPIMLLVAVAIKVTSPGPIIFKQERVGLNRRTFMMYKFRSMKCESAVVANTGWTTADDPRKTKLGTFLRKTSLDELPQFFNVLKGDMSVVGPRPERPHFVDQFKEEIPKYMIKHHVRPGITGWAQVCGLRGDTSIKERIVHDIFYIENWTLLFDIKIVILTFIKGFINKNAY
ncbi:undecaprenyl-phosphate glucose phosphotransferase [Bacillus sp. HMF5848]|uniref:undecaprenyl-phosphate glucose phosphotransferase n=1 Tax=Bacillus sp. HMF5848 TaxID=2495421 RepID=UPI000F76C163|nr:undecaprenyl-phosphate glucose phosphotransferase [Bacillus sp. HMF5848]RSK28663.1 undecaprenyl-phosphate glucose phosphotransferase [Bacillus sp. HMF5848]